MSRELCLMDGNTMIIGRDNVIDHFVRDASLGSPMRHATHACVIHLAMDHWRNAKLDNLLFERDIP